MHVFTAQLAFSLCGLMATSKSSRNMVTACNNSRICPLLLLVLRLDKSFLAHSTPYCVIASIRLSCDGLQALSYSN